MIHFVGGFGRIYPVKPSDFLLTEKCSDDLVDIEADIIEHMNSDHNDAVQLFATKLLGARADNWKVSGCDAEGCDLIANGKTLRLAFTKPLVSIKEARHAFVELAVLARAH
jgi:putative heme iron utilization protein